MIPIRLNLNNFLAYRSPNPIVFDGIHLACLSGQNGAGKSSLLDAVTWALWGKARTRHDNDLIHIGTNRMYVELDFYHEGQQYRVTRSRERRGRSGSGRLRLDIYDENGQLNEISEPSIGATQTKINQLLRLEYETFINSAFLQQGEADAFTVKKPAQRKQILSNILGLERWSVYEERVKTKQSRINEHLTALRLRIEEIDERLKTEPQRRQDLADAEAAQSHAAEQLEIAEGLLREVENAPSQLKNALDQEATETKRRENYVKQLENIELEIDERAEEIANAQAIYDQREEIVAGYEALEAARAANEALNEVYRSLSGIDRAITELEGKIAAEKAGLEAERTALVAQIESLTHEATSDDAQLADKQAEVDALQATAAERTALQGEISALDTEYATLDGTNRSLRITMNELKERIEALEVVEGAMCPLCGQDLTEEHRASLLEELQAQGKTQGDTFRANAARMQTIHDTRNEMKVRFEELAVEIQPLEDRQRELGQLQQQSANAQKAAKKLAEVEEALSNVETTLAEATFGAELRVQIAEKQAEREALGYDEEAHDAHGRTLKEYSDFGSRYNDLVVVEKTLPALIESQEKRHERAEELASDIAAQETTIQHIAAEIEGLRTLNETYEERRQEAMALRTAKAQADEKVGEARQALKALEEARKRRSDYEERQLSLAEKKAVYDELREAFGKNGVPAMIIETAIPELEATTNELLTRITDGRMAVKFNMQREKITGGTAETLDIEIADELGTRNYDLYSGGEAFRINFAVRVALSKMLARRAGAHLETLFIDEGFGTQDADGRSKLVEAINAIRDEFSLILVITHIDELKDAFPVHIQVEKTPDGSQISLL